MSKPANGAASEAGWITARDVVERLMSFAHLKRVASNCVLHATRRDGQWMFRRDDLEAWIREQTRTGSGE